MRNDAVLYNRLGLPVNATTEDIRHSYREAALRLHPDTNTDPGETEIFLSIQQAYDVISDPAKRAAYDKTLPASEFLPPRIKFSTLYSRKVLPILPEAQLLYVYFEAQSTGESDTLSTTPLNACLVIDTSTSMQGNVLDTVKAASIEILKTLRPHDAIGLVSFNDTARVVVPCGGSSDPKKLDMAVRLMRAGGGTEIFRGLEAGYQEIKKCLQYGYSNHLILITDGRTYGDEPACLHLAQQALVDGITISAIGIGSKWNDKFLDYLSSLTGGSSLYVSRTEEIRAFMKEKFQHIGHSYASRSNLTLHLAPEVELRYAFRLNPEPGPVELAAPIQLGSIPLGGSLAFLLELEIQKLNKRAQCLQIAAGSFEMDIPSRLVSCCRQRFTLERDASFDGDASLPPEQISQALSKLTLYRMQERVQSEIAAGNVAEAAASLRYMSTSLLARGEHDLAKAVLTEAAQIESSRDLSEEGKKKIKYGTRSLLLSRKGRLDTGGNG
jgi:Ca-activated chloride channel family protein